MTSSSAIGAGRPLLPVTLTRPGGLMGLAGVGEGTMRFGIRPLSARSCAPTSRPGSGGAHLRQEAVHLAAQSRGLPVDALRGGGDTLSRLADRCRAFGHAGNVVGTTEAIEVATVVTRRWCRRSA